MTEATEPQLSKLYVYPAPQSIHNMAFANLFHSQQIDDTVNVMRQNIQRTEERGARVDHIQAKTQGMEANAALFQRGTNRVRKNLVWKNAELPCPDIVDYKSSPGLYDWSMAFCQIGARLSGYTNAGFFAVQPRT
ncbi:MAG: hypothetical protein Q9179_006096 [Wetmoreana sp. 5 TL-2023]